MLTEILNDAGNGKVFHFHNQCMKSCTAQINETQLSNFTTSQLGNLFSFKTGCRSKVFTDRFLLLGADRFCSHFPSCVVRILAVLKTRFSYPFLGEEFSKIIIVKIEIQVESRWFRINIETWEGSMKNYLISSYLIYNSSFNKQFNGLNSWKRTV